MKCPKCNIDLYDKCCPRCGYLENGNKVSLKDKPEKYIDEKNFNRKFDILNRNGNKIYPFIFTGYYVAFHKYLITGLLIILIKWLCVFGLVSVFSSIPYIGEYTFLIIFIFLFSYHMLIGATANTIILFLDRCRIKLIKKRHPKDYPKILYKNSSTSILPLLLIVLIYTFLLYLLSNK